MYFDERCTKEDGAENMSELILETSRLLLRPLSAKDIEDVYEYNSDYEVVKYMYELSVKPGEVFPKERTLEFLKSCDEEWKKENLDFYEFGVVEKESGSFIGNICVYLDEKHEEGELGWTFNRKFHSKGFCTEAALRMKEFCFENLKLNKIIARCDERNIPSRRVMEKIGLKFLWGNGPRKYPNTGEESTEAMFYIERN